MNQDTHVTPVWPHLVPALYNWLYENDCHKIFLRVGMSYVRDKMPQHVLSKAIDEQSIVLNIGPAACRGLHMGDTSITFQARFDGMETDLEVPYESIFSIYDPERVVSLYAIVNQHALEAKEETPNEPVTKERPKLTIV